MYNFAVEGVQFTPTAVFSQMRRGCSTSYGQGVQLGRYIQLRVLIEECSEEEAAALIPVLESLLTALRDNNSKPV